MFVYGTLLPDQSNWHVIEPFALGSGVPDTVRGRLYDTGLGWPAATFAARTGDRRAPRIAGRVLDLRPEVLDHALAVLDEFEGIHEGAYVRIVVTTDSGVTAWAYHSNDPGHAAPIRSGDWARHVDRRRREHDAASRA